ncbi:MAG: PAS domain S-box protein [Deltaproteobacteria bacterium]|nr:PAS domain S-box protein [Deltaproteobacteria bacterium]
MKTWNNQSKFNALQKRVEELEKQVQERDQLLEHFCFLAENSADFVWEVNEDSVYTHVSPKITQLLGYEAQEVIGKRNFELMPPEESERAARVFSEMASNRKPFHLPENRNIHKDGRIIHIDTSAVPVFDVNGEFRGYRGTGREIKKDNRADELLRYIVNGTSSVVGQEFFRSLVKHLASALNMDFILLGELLEGRRDRIRTTAVWACNDYAPNFEYDLADTPCANVVGLEMCVYSKGVQELFPKDHLLIEMGIESYIGVPLFASDGSAMGILVGIHSKPMNAISLAESILSIFAARAAAELERRKKDEEMKLYSELVAHMAEGATLIRASDSRIIYTNQQFDQLFGYEKDELLERPAEILSAPIPEKGSSEVYANLIEAVKKSRIWNGEVLNVKKNGKIFCSYTSASMFESSRYGAVLLCLHRDITERKHLEKETLKVQKLESVGLLAGGIAHDFNNLLTGILGNISLIKYTSEKDEFIFQRIERLEKAALQASNLTKQLLTFAKGGDPVKEVVSLGELLTDTASFAIRDSNVKCSFSIAQDLRHVIADPWQITHVINNLTVNAVQAMPNGGEIQLRAENITVKETSNLPLKSGEYVKISIEDSGIGISEENLQKVFDPYFTTKQTGSGLGLAVSYSIIKNHDGYIGVSSLVEKGTSFQIYLPTSDIKTAPNTGEDITVKGKGRILIMDDEELVRDIALEALTYLGYDVQTSKEGRQAVNMYKEAIDKGIPFSAVIMDLTIPGGMGGREAIIELLKFDPNARVIVSSGYSKDAILQDYRKYGFRGFVAKPYNIAALSKAVDQVINDDHSK